MSDIQIEVRDFNTPVIRFVILTDESSEGLYKEKWLLGEEDGNSNFDSGVDLRFPDKVVIEPGEVVRVDMGVVVVMYTLFYSSLDPRPIANRSPFFIVPRSSIAKPAKVVGGEPTAARALALPNSPAVMDVSYNGNTLVQLHNTGKETVVFNRGDSVVQAVAPTLFSPEYISVPKGSKAAQTVLDSAPGKRGAGGFGSTGASGTGVDATKCSL